jgi:hypothetical protein
MRALKELLLRGAVTVLICALVALGVAGLLSLIATSFQPNKQVVVETVAPTGSCRRSHCRLRAGGGHQLVTARAQ